jgi:chromatin remodeling complex protein RSC6
MATKKPVKKAAAKKAPAKKAAVKKAPAKKAAVKKAPAKKAAKAPAKKRAPNAAFMRPMTIGEALHSIVGNQPIPRSEVIKRLWAYIKKHNLQDPKEKRNINADAALQKVFGGKKTVSMFEMTKHVNNHLK